jgi:hypothetical protein
MKTIGKKKISLVLRQNNLAELEVSRKKFG